jgi:hypothetical protein
MLPVQIFSTGRPTGETVAIDIEQILRAGLA